MIYTPSFIEIGSCDQKLMGGGGIQTYRQHCDCTSLLLLLQNKGSRIETVMSKRGVGMEEKVGENTETLF
jgi:hypothetical protein